MKKKITEIPITRMRTFHYRDVYGNLVKDAEEIEINRPVNTVSGGKKFANFFVDYLAYFVLASIIDIPMVFLISSFMEDDFNRMAPVLMLQVFNVISYPLYYFAFEATLQKSPAKYLTRCIVINEYCEKPDIASIALRSLIRLVPFEMFSCMSDNGRGWHDRWSGTWVVGDEEYRELKSLLGGEDLSSANPEILG